MASIQNDDERLLARIGYNQELRREFNKWSTVSYAISILGVLGSVPATFGSPITAGGPATAVWAWFVGSVMAMCIASSVAELVSAYPTAGGMYFVTKHVVPPEHVAIWAWVIGWCNFLGQAAGVASLAYTISQMIFAAAVMNSTAEDGSPTFTPAEWVFTEVTDGSGWGSKGFSFLLGFLSVAWTMTDYDGTTHMSEETHDAAIRGPVAIRSAILVSGLVGWMLTVTFCFCLTDYDGIVNSPTGLPVAQIFLNAGGKTGGTIMWFFVILVQFFTGCSAMLANARMCYAFARDDALPFSSFWSNINKYTGTPVNAVWLVVVFCTCLDLIGIGSTLTIVAIFNVCAPALDLSYVAVIVAHRVYEKRVRFIPGPYTMGIWSKPINLVACSWVVFISVILFFPTTKPVTPTNMNYAICVAGKYTGPRTKDIIDMLPTDDPDDTDFP
ncbi:polyamine transporter tpo5 [Diplodia intermedia]|uniref:Polyamine transporter tpo5 n=1 Tax=Diplodia intermedia TaxID=856260 RepID=A0ABR3TD95_9PEZI